MNQIILFQRGISLNNFRPIKILFSLFNSWNIIFTFKSILTKLKKYFWNLKYFFEMFNTFKFCMIESKRSDRIIIRWKIWNKCKKIILEMNDETKSSKQFATWSFSEHLWLGVSLFKSPRQRFYRSLVLSLASTYNHTFTYLYPLRLYVYFIENFK